MGCWGLLVQFTPNCKRKWLKRQHKFKWNVASDESLYNWSTIHTAGEVCSVLISQKSAMCLVYAGPVWQLDHSSRNDTCLLYTLYGCQGSDRSADSDSLTGSPWLWRADPLRHRTAANVTAKLNGFSCCAGTKTNYSNGDQSLVYASAGFFVRSL